MVSITVLGGESTTESTMLSNVSKLSFKFNVIHRFQGIRAQSILDQLHSLARQIATLSFGTNCRQPLSDPLPLKNFLLLGKKSHYFYKSTGNNYLKHARRFVDATGLLPKQQEVFQGQQVRKWLTTMRAKAKRGDLSGERMQLIEDALGADALKPVDDIEFERKLADVAEHRKLYGRLPAQHGDARHLGSWVNDVRRRANNGSLSKAYAQRLDTILGVEWKPKFKNVTVCSHHTTACHILSPSMYHAGIVCECADM